jgi:hypothetical protein
MACGVSDYDTVACWISRHSPALMTRWSYVIRVLLAVELKGHVLTTSTLQFMEQQFTCVAIFGCSLHDFDCTFDGSPQRIDQKSDVSRLRPLSFTFFDHV